MQQEWRAAPGPSELVSQPASAVPTLWEQVCLRATPQERTDLFNLAAQQGCLLGHQVHGRLPCQVIDNPALAEPVGPPCPIEPLDATLDASQREAVSKALTTPDLCLVQGLPGTGKSRVAAEVLIQACQRGERALLVSATGNAIDRILGMIESCPDVLPGRLAEGADDAAAQAQQGRLEERFRAIAAQARTQALGDLAQAEQRCQLGKERAALVARLHEVVAELDKLRTEPEHAGNGHHAHTEVEHQIVGTETRRKADAALAQLRADAE